MVRRPGPSHASVSRWVFQIWVELLEHARREAEAGEKFLEFRLDYLEHPERGAQAISGFLEHNPECIVLATCRRHQNHGKFNGSIEEELRVLDEAVLAGRKPWMWRSRAPRWRPRSWASFGGARG